MQRSIEGLRVTPWADWSEWWELKEMLSRGMVREANERVQCYLIRRRQAVPIAMITTVNLRYQLDYPSPDEYSQRLGLAMALVRFVNGMTDRLQPRGENAHAKSVHGLSLDLGLPLILVEIRHQASHNAMPQLSALESGARKALEWLDDFYWKAQEEKIRHQKGRTPSILRNVFSPRSVPRISSSSGEDAPTNQVMANKNDTDNRETDDPSVLKDLKQLIQGFGEGRKQESGPACFELECSKDLAKQWVECEDSEEWKRMPVGLIPGQSTAPRRRVIQAASDDESTCQEYCSQETENEIRQGTSDAHEDFEKLNKRLCQKNNAIVDKMTSHYEKLLRTV